CGGHVTHASRLMPRSMAKVAGAAGNAIAASSASAGNPFLNMACNGAIRWVREAADPSHLRGGKESAMSNRGEPEAEGLSGELTPDGHRLLARVYFADTDFSGVVYHARYLEFFERGRSDF